MLDRKVATPENNKRKETLKGKIEDLIRRKSKENEALKKLLDSLDQRIPDPGGKVSTSNQSKNQKKFSREK